MAGPRARSFARSRACKGASIAFSLVLALAACSGKSGNQDETQVPKDLAKADTVPAQDGGLGTPLKDRVATLGVLNKRNNLSQDIKLKPGEARRWGDVIVRLASCERTAPWETPPETGAFVQVYTAQRKAPGATPEWNKVFSGWLFKNSPSLNVVEHPIYDVWVKDCEMSFPGEEKTEAASPSSAAKPSGSPAPEPSAAPSTEPAQREDDGA